MKRLIYVMLGSWLLAGLAGSWMLAQETTRPPLKRAKRPTFRPAEVDELLGDPTVLTQSRDSSFGFSSAEDFARAFSEQFGSSFSRDQASSSSNATSRSRGRSRSASVGFL